MIADCYGEGVTQSDSAFEAAAIELLRSNLGPNQSMMQYGYLRDSVQNVARCVSQFMSSASTPGSDSYRHVVVFTIVLRSRQTNLQFEIQEIEGGGCKYHRLLQLVKM